MTLAFYLDDDVEEIALVDALQREGIDVLRSTEAGNHAAADRDHLSFAAQTRRSLVTTNRRDFVLLH